MKATFSTDSNGDGVSDWDEANTWQAEAAAANAHLQGDSDGDGVSDLVEMLNLGTDPGNPDTDGDGSSDGAELSANTNPVDGGSHP
jgi:hypothetical protein